jgi:DNA-binding MarR family transcriptional regulator
VNQLLIRAARAQRGQAARLLAPHGLYPGQEALLQALWDRDGRTQADLAEELGVEPPTITKMLQRMEQADLVERTGDPEDRRALRVHLTARGKRLRPRVERALAELQSRTVAGLSAREQAQLRALLERVAANLGR